MSYNQNKDRKNPMANIRGIMGMTMGVAYVVIGGAVVYFEKLGQIQLGKGLSYMIAGLMAGYGIFRIYRGYKIMKGE